MTESRTPRRIYYISPSVMPSRSANSVHVARMAEALALAGHSVAVCFKRSIRGTTGLRESLETFYGVKLEHVRLVSFYSRVSAAENLCIALRAAGPLAAIKSRDVIISRNLYVSYGLARFRRRPFIFETHQLEYGARKAMQAAAMRAPHALTVAISSALVELLTEHHGFAPQKVLVLPDAAPAGIGPLAPDERFRMRKEIAAGLGMADLGWCAGYFGQLFAGRGINIIIALAERNPQVLFLVFGGGDEDLRRFRAEVSRPNLRFMGHVPPRKTSPLMAAMDCLLMPYQANVSIGVRGHDTSRWMSPMKMFEYMASGVPLVASDLPALREVLCDGDNSLLASAADVDAWSRCVTLLIQEPEMAAAIGRKAHRDYKDQYTWDQRVQKMLEAHLKNER